jgi:hypothetical protein
LYCGANLVARQGHPVISAALDRALKAFACLSAALTLAACASGNTFTPPPQAAPQTAAPVVPDSQLVLSASVPYAELREAARAKLPPTLPVNGQKPLVCAQVPYAAGGSVTLKDKCADVPYCDLKGCGTRRQCSKLPQIIPPSVGFQQSCANSVWTANLHPDGPMTLQKSGDALLVEQPVRIEGQATVGGDLAGLMKKGGGRNFAARLVPGALIRVDMDSNWCPILQVTPTERWVSEAKVETFSRTCTTINLGPLGQHPVCAGPANLDLTAVAKLSVKDAQKGLIKTVNEALACDKVRSQIGAVWKTTAIALPETAGQKLYLNLIPSSASLAGLTLGEDQLKLVARLSVHTQISTTPVATTSLPLPPLGRSTDTDGALDLNIEANAPYSVLKSAIGAQLIGQTFKAAAPGGESQVQVLDFDLYPSGEALTVGLKVHGRLPGRAVDETGWVYLTGRPEMSADGRTLNIAGLKFAVVLGNPFLKLVVSLFNAPIMAALNANAHFDLNPAMTQAAHQISTGIANAHLNGVTLEAGPPQLSLKRVSVARDGVVAHLNLQMPLSARLSRSLAMQ